MPALMYPRSEVAEVALWAHRNGRPLHAAVAAHFEIRPEHAKTLIRSARKRGHPIPFVKAEHMGRAIPRRPIVDASLACTSCGWSCELDARAMEAHTVTAHRRHSTTAERTPQERAA